MNKTNATLYQNSKVESADGGNDRVLTQSPNSTKSVAIVMKSSYCFKIVQLDLLRKTSGKATMLYTMKSKETTCTHRYLKTSHIKKPANAVAAPLM